MPSLSWWIRNDVFPYYWEVGMKSSNRKPEQKQMGIALLQKFLSSCVKHFRSWIAYLCLAETLMHHRLRGVVWALGVPIFSICSSKLHAYPASSLERGLRLFFSFTLATTPRARLCIPGMASKPLLMVFISSPAKRSPQAQMETWKSMK